MHPPLASSLSVADRSCRVSTAVRRQAAFLSLPSMSTAVRRQATFLSLPTALDVLRNVSAATRTTSYEFDSLYANADLDAAEQTYALKFVKRYANSIRQAMAAK